MQVQQKNSKTVDAEYGDQSDESSDHGDRDHLISDDESSYDESSYDEDSMFQEDPNALVSCTIEAIARIQYIWLYHKTEFILGIILLISVTLAVTGIIEKAEGYESGPYHKRPVIHDYSDIKSVLELRQGDIDHYCLQGGDDKCPWCEDPLEAMPLELEGWKAYMKNVMRAEDVKEKGKELDVVFIGDSITEARSGTEGGINKAPLQKIKEVFDSQFSKEKNGAYDGLALGCVGCTSPNLLWRITQNEVPKDLNPKVWWITIGMNDMFRTMCSEEVTVMGIIRVVEELFKTRPGATIVINSLLPRATSSKSVLKGKFIQSKYWDSIEQVNSNLKSFAMKHEKRVIFFDANKIFVNEFRGKLSMKRDLFLDRMHPNEKGHKLWGEAQVKLIANVLSKMEDHCGHDINDHPCDDSN